MELLLSIKYILINFSLSCFGKYGVYVFMSVFYAFSPLRETERQLSFFFVNAVFKKAIICAFAVIANNNKNCNLHGAYALQQYF